MWRLRGASTLERKGSCFTMVASVICSTMVSGTQLSMCLARFQGVDSSSSGEFYSPELCTPLRLLGS